jgi:hypothetical protein
MQRARGQSGVGLFSGTGPAALALQAPNLKSESGSGVRARRGGGRELRNEDTGAGASSSKSQIRNPKWGAEYVRAGAAVANCETKPRRWRFKFQISNSKSERGSGEHARWRRQPGIAKRSQGRWRFKLSISNPESERGGTSPDENLGLKDFVFSISVDARDGFCWHSISRRSRRPLRERFFA